MKQSVGEGHVLRDTSVSFHSPTTMLALLSTSMIVMTVDADGGVVVNERFGHFMRDIIGILHRRGFHQVGTWPFQSTTQPSVSRDFHQDVPRR